jgi:hypothetical protein
MSRQRQRVGKIAHLPAEIREQINRRLYDGQTGKQIIRWLKTQMHEVASADISDSNISQWRQGGYQDWLKDEAQVTRTRQRAELAMRLAKAAGGSVSQSVCAQLAGRIDEKLDCLSDEDIEKMKPLLDTLNEAEKMRLKRIEVDQKVKALNLLREKFEVETCEKFVEWSKDETSRQILDSDVSTSEKVAALRKRHYADVDAIEDGVQIPT